ncbi:hypothetical protein OGAPHI_001093 [Ogataea philodendri]|uniref:Uncharacterized protein n=1 Tax=Ogataea philodendri TaxID=1378263 RepID=A0A9P8T8R7_9ASCO|nr:uncharacterized protein OGAPHI_001093 [Ogataea philodendri]KAH3670578.1 hypothetical protein OGAPHI_001093 [Ogataea philodendri]
MVFFRPSWNTDLEYERHARALNMSNSTKHVNVIVVSLLVTESFISLTYTYMVPMIMKKAAVSTRLRTATVRIRSDRDLGGLFITSWSTGSTPSDWAGGPSIRMLIHRICMAFSGFGRLNKVDTAISDSAATDVDSWNVRKFWMLLKIPLPSLMACKIVEKSSSVSTMSAASLATSVPFLPIAIPMSASFKAGASFTPSPVMATMSPRSCKARTMATLCSGVVLANTETY